MICPSSADYSMKFTLYIPKVPDTIGGNIIITEKSNCGYSYSTAVICTQEYNYPEISFEITSEVNRLTAVDTTNSSKGGYFSPLIIIYLVIATYNRREMRCSNENIQ